MGNYCFGRLDEPESPRNQGRTSVATPNVNSTNTTRLRQSNRQRNIIHEYYLPQIHENDPIYHPAPGVSRPMSQLTEEEQIMIATRMGLLSTLPMFIFDESKKEKFTECIICMCEYTVGEECRHLPCLHTFHRKCIDDWLIRSFTCPSCLEQVDTILLSNQNNKNGESVGKHKKKRRRSLDRVTSSTSANSPNPNQTSVVTNNTDVPDRNNMTTAMTTSEQRNVPHRSSSQHRSSHSNRHHHNIQKHRRVKSITTPSAVHYEKQMQKSHKYFSDKSKDDTILRSARTVSGTDGSDKNIVVKESVSNDNNNVTGQTNENYSSSSTALLQDQGSD